MKINVNKNSHIPIYFQIQKQIRKQIEEGKLPLGAQLPTERELSSRLGVSRVTIRKAISGLISEGYCTKRVGKGIFVSDEKIPTYVHSLEGTTNSIEKIGFSLQTEVINKEVIKPTQKITNKLELNEGEEILFLKRLRYVEQEPVMLESTYLPLRLFKGIEDYNFDQSLYKIIQNNYDVQPYHASGIFNILLAKEEEAKFLNLKLNTALLVKEATVYTEEELPFEYHVAVYRTDRFKFIVDAKIQK